MDMNIIVLFYKIGFFVFKDIYGLFLIVIIGVLFNLLLYLVSKIIN